MKLNNHIIILSSCLAILLSSSLAGCNAVSPAKADSPAAALTGQKANHGTPPQTMMPTPPWSVKDAFSYDFNHDGTPDWVVVAYHNTHDDWLEHHLSIALSQPDGKYQPVFSSNFDPSEKGNEPWRMSAMLTDSGDLRITNNKASPFSGSDNQNSYRFRFMDGEFVLQEYTFGYGSSTSGSTFIYGLANHIYRKQDAGRCDYAPEKPCVGTKDAKLATVPKLTLSTVEGSSADNSRFFEKYITK